MCLSLLLSTGGHGVEDKGHERHNFELIEEPGDDIYIAHNVVVSQERKPLRRYRESHTN